MIFLITYQSNVFAEDSVWLPKDTPAPYSGYLLPKDKVNELRNNTLQLQTSKQIIDSQAASLQYKSNIINDLTTNDDILTKRNRDLEDAVTKNQSTDHLEHILYFIGGVVVTSLAVWGASQLRK